MVRTTQKDIERFNGKWTQEGECRIWKGKLDRDGYGTFFFLKKNRRAHRVSYYIHIGEIPKGMFVDHLCKNRNCVAVGHLRLVTPKENSLDNSRSIPALNARKTHCKQGHLFDRKYGKQRYCSVCQSEKTRRLRQKWRDEANAVMC
jgi:hypothetical protein